MVGRPCTGEVTSGLLVRHHRTCAGVESLLLASELTGRMPEERVKLLGFLHLWLTDLSMQENSLRLYSTLRKDPGLHLIGLLARSALF